MFNKQNSRVTLQAKTAFCETLEGENFGRNEARTRVALINPANVSPTRSDNSSVANAKSCGVRITRLGMVE